MGSDERKGMERTSQALGVESILEPSDVRVDHSMRNFAHKSSDFYFVSGYSVGQDEVHEM